MWINFQDTVAQRLEREILDTEQNKAKNVNIYAHALVRGIAGSGKSLVLRNRVEKIIEAGMTNILVLSYNRFMNGWLQSKLLEKGIQLEQCCTFHSWAYRQLKYNYKWDENEFTRAKVIELANNLAIELRKKDQLIDAILIDEAQDFYDEWYQALLAVLNPETNSLFFVYDNTQSVYGQSHRRKRDWSWLKLGIDVRGRSQVFDLNYRNSPEIMETAWQFILPSLKGNNMIIGDRKKSYENPG
jgi:superfamily I DNA/RNA helicase